MKERIKFIRKNAGLTQEEFAQVIGLSRNMVSKVESDMATFSDRSIKDIARIFHVNEEWILTGEGNPYQQKTKQIQLAEFMNEIMEIEDKAFKKQLIEGLASLDRDDWEALAKIFQKLADAHKNEE